MSSDFKAAYTTVMTIEGGWANNPSDRGGETYKGISRKNFPNWPGWRTIDLAKKLADFPKSLSSDVTLAVSVADFFRENFWTKNRLMEFTDQNIALEMFDTGVNMGTATAAMFLQRTLNVLNRGGTDYPDTIVDGVIGRTTIALVNNHKNPRLVYDVLNTMQGAKYIAICEADHSQEKFMYGWATRVYN